MVHVLIMGDDKQAVAAVVKVSDPQANVKLLRRSVKHLYSIEVSDEDTEELPVSISLKESINHHQMAVRRNHKMCDLRSTGDHNEGEN